VQVHDGDELLLISDKGTLVRTTVNEVSLQGRNTQGVRLINLSAGEKLVGIQRIRQITAETIAAQEALNHADGILPETPLD
jgi:DNA gyrase subunit A